MTVTPPKWDILVPTLGERSALFLRLMTTLLPQTEPYGGRVRVTAWHNDGSPPLPVIRQRMVQSSSADYVCFVDDDDLVAPDYVSSIVAALDQWPDYVGFQVQCYSDSKPTLIAHHSLKHGDWINLPDRYLRDISHINPIRRTIAAMADFRRARPGQPEDRAWVGQLRRSGLLHDEVIVDRILYHYLYSTSRKRGEGSRWRRPQDIHRGGSVTGVAHPNFSWSNPS